MTSGNRRHRRGFAYVLLLVSLAIVGVAAASAVTMGSTMARRDAEEALLAVGEEFSTALASYRGAANVAAAGPRDLADLLRDPRFPGVRRHLRKLYADPMSGSDEWGLIHDPTGAIVAIYSRAPGRPIKQQGFGERHAGFANASSYADWRFGDPAARAAVPAGSADRAR
jgi:type II secretory pathway pseudopilin PulG